MSQLQEDRWQGAVEPDAAGQGACGPGAASGGVEPVAEQELPGGVPAPAALASGCAQGDHGGGAQAGPDRVQPDALRRGVHETGGGEVRPGGARATGAAVASPGTGAGLRAEAAGAA